MYEKILVPLDCSPVDEAILDHVQKLAAVHNSEIIFLRVAYYFTRDAKTAEVEEARVCLARLEEKFNALGIRARSVMAHGHPVTVIVEQATALNCDLIAMATHGHRAIGDMLFGSVADAVRHRTNIPLLLIKAPRPEAR